MPIGNPLSTQNWMQVTHEIHSPVNLGYYLTICLGNPSSIQHRLSHGPRRRSRAEDSAAASNLAGETWSCAARNDERRGLTGQR